MATANKHRERSHRSYHQKPYRQGKTMWKGNKIPRLTFMELLKAMLHRTADK